MNALANFVVKWTGPAQAQVAQRSTAEKAEAEERVREHAQTHATNATQGRIRKHWHEGGTNQDEPEHLTVTYKNHNRDMGAWHVYRDKSKDPVQVEQ